MSALPAPSRTGTTGPLLSVDLRAVAANTHLIGTMAGGRLMAVVKAYGFGHGDLAVARTALANGATRLGVTALPEAFALRSAGITAPVLSWLNTVDADFETAVREHIDIAIPSIAHLHVVATAAARARLAARVHLHIDVGMARDGATAQEWTALTAQARAAQRRGLVDVLGVMGHLACADQPDHPSNATGRRAFAEAVEVTNRAGLRPRLRHLAATAATLTDPRTRLDLCRVGAGLFGIDPIGGSGLREALTLTAPVVTVRDVAAGTPVGYGHTHVTDRGTRLALLPVGYADGIPRDAHGWVQVRSRRCPIVGRVSMDQVVIDVGTIPIGPGEQVTVFGPGDAGEPTVAEWARWAGTIPNEIVTGIGHRIPRVTCPIPRSIR